MPLPAHLPLPPAWQDHREAASVAALWAAPAQEQREEGLCWLMKPPLVPDEPSPESALPKATAPVEQSRWLAWCDAGLPVDAIFPMPVAAPTRIQGTGDKRKVCHTTVLGHALRQRWLPLVHAALARGADPNGEEWVVVPGNSLGDRTPIGVNVGRQVERERYPVARTMLAHGWDPVPAGDGPFSYLGLCVSRFRRNELEMVARERPDLDWNNVNRNGQPLISLIYLLPGIEHGENQEKVRKSAHWLLDHGADPLRVPERDRARLLLKAIDWGDLGLLERLLVPGMPDAESTKAHLATRPRLEPRDEALMRRRAQGLAFIEAATLQRRLPSANALRRRRF